MTLARTELFTGRSIETLEPVELSPSPLGRYVITGMPQDLEAVREQRMPYEELHSRQAALLETVAEQIIENDDSHIAAITQLDLSFMLGGYLPLEDRAFHQAPSQLLELLHLQSERFGFSPYMDYELIIDANAEEFMRTGHMRTYLTGDFARGERDFYLGHHLCEPFVRSAAELLCEVTENPKVTDLEQIFTAARDNVSQFRKYMAAYINLSTEAFGNMRPYLASYPDGTRNASGAFMPSVQLLELTMHAPTEEQSKYLQASAAYFPRWARDLITMQQERSANGINLTDMITEGQLRVTAAERTAFQGVIDEFTHFRKTHSAVTRKQLPQAFSANPPISTQQLREFGEPDIFAAGSKGTADFSVENLLGGTTYRLVVLGDTLRSPNVGSTEVLEG